MTGRDAWAAFTRFTPARIALGRTGDGLPTERLLEFQLAHAQARDAVHAPFEPERLAADLGEGSIVVRSRAHDRATYLQRPDLGRQVEPEDVVRLPQGPFDVALLVADGLSAAAVHAHAAPLLAALRPRLDGLQMSPPVLVRQGRVAVGDGIGAAMRAALVLLLIGERPGLSAPDSLGAYLTFAPRDGRRDAERNCVSNIRPPHGLAYGEAAHRIAFLVRTALRLQLTGVDLKDEPPPLPAPDAPA